MVRSSPTIVPTRAIPVVDATNLAGLRQVPPHAVAHAGPQHHHILHDTRDR